LRNDRATLTHILTTLGQEEGVVSLRLVDAAGNVRFSTSAAKKAARADQRTLRVLTPIPNAPGCYSAACHAHPASLQTLGALDVNLSLADADADILSASRQFI